MDVLQGGLVFTTGKLGKRDRSSTIIMTGILLGGTIA